MTNDEALNQISEIIEQYNQQVDSVIDYAEVRISYPQAIALYKAQYILRKLTDMAKNLAEEYVDLLDVDYPRRDDYWDGYNTGYHDCEVEQQAKQQEGELVVKTEERPQGEWIPVTKRLPADRDWYLGQFKEPDTDFIGIPYICDYVGEVTKGTTNEGWILRHCTDVDNPSDYFRNLICVAWQPLPKPYKEGDAE